MDGRNAAFDANLAYADALSGRPGEVREILAELERRSAVSPSVDASVALVYLGLGDQSAAMAWLERAYAAHFNPSILMRPAWDPLRFDIRFKDLLRRVALPE